MTSDLDPYLLGLVLDGRSVVVVGAGTIAARRVERLLSAGARVRLIAPVASPALRDRGAELCWEARCYAPGDLAEAWYALAATNDPAVNAAVAAEAERRRIFCVRVDDAAGGSARTPATVVEDGVLVGVLTRHTIGHGDPGRIRRLRDGLAAALRGLLAAET